MHLDDIDVSKPELYRSNTMWPYFERLRKEDPVHYCPQSRVGDYWSITKYKDIMQVETSHSLFSSDVHLGGIGIQDVKPVYARESFIAMDEPKHSAQRQDRAADVHAAEPGHARRDHPRPRLRDPRQPAAQRDLRLGRQGLGRAHHADAGDPVRFSVGGAAQADALVERCDRGPGQPRDHRLGESARRRVAGVRRLFCEALGRARQAADEDGPSVDDGAQRRHPRTWIRATSSAT